jgi:cellulose biosynthesis protein BcsQ
MAELIAIGNQKGGCGTMTAINLSGGLTEKACVPPD